MRASFVVAAALAITFFNYCSPQRRIFNGRDAKDSEFPYIASVQVGGTTCGGTLIHVRYVLTAAHCLMDRFEGEKIRVMLGSTNFYAFGKEPYRKEFKTEKYWIHENFSMPSANDDIAVIQLPQPVELTKGIKTIQISRDKNIDQRNREVVPSIVGWDLMDYLQTAKMKLIPIEDCLKFQKDFVEKITRDHICALGKDNKPGHIVSPCDGDSGESRQSNVNKLLHAFTTLVLSPRFTFGRRRDKRINWHNELCEGC